MTGPLHPGPPGGVTFDQLAAATQTANWAFRGAGVQFYVASVKSASMGALLPADDPQANVPWGAARPALVGVFPGLSAFPNLPADSSPSSRVDWLYYAATRFSEPEEIVVWVTPDDATYPSIIDGPQPIQARAMRMGGNSFGDRWKFVHELGHFFGLPHSDAELNKPAGVEYVCLPNAAAECDRTTTPKQGVSTRADFWDHVFLPGTSATNPHRAFTSRYAAQLAEAENPAAIDLQWIDNGLPDGQGGNCVVDWGLEASPSNGTANCAVAAPGGGWSETWTTTNTHAAKLRGYMWPTTVGGRRGVAMMSYRYEPPAWAPYWPAGFSNSQTEMIRLNLRYDVKIREAPYLPAAGATGGRPFLGRKVARRPADQLDLDGDGLRDLAIWVPPVDPGGLGRFGVLTSRSGFTIQLTMDFGAVGDTPVVADYNGDGFADFAVLHDLGVVADDLAQKQWRICSSTATAPVPPEIYPTVTHSCATPLQTTWGDRGDVPYVGTRLSASSAGELTVYRKSNKTLYTRFLPSFTRQDLQLNNLGGYDHQAPFVGYYDADSRSDVATYIPQQGMFRLWLSSESFGTEHLFNFCHGQSPSTCKFVPQSTGTSAQRGGAVPAWGLAAMRTTATSPVWRTKPRGAFGLFDPSDGVWTVMWDPLGDQAITTHQWGITGDLVVDGSIGLPVDGSLLDIGRRGDLAVYRSNDSSGPGYVHRCSSAGYTCPGGSAQQAITIPGGSLRRDAFAVADMVGDGKPELCVFDPIVGGVRCHTSDSGYTTVIERFFLVPNADFL